MYTADPACAAAPNFIVMFAHYRAGGPSHGVPSASFPQPIEHASTSPPTVAVDACMPVTSAAPACASCDEGMYCHPDGTCQSTPYASNHDVGEVELAVDGTSVGKLAFERTSYEPIGELATRVVPLWRVGGERLAATNAAFAVEVIAPAVPEVTSFAHTLAPQIEPANQDLALTWHAGNPGDVIEIAVGTMFTYTYCVATDDGAFAIPWQVFEDIGKGEGGELFVFVNRTRRAVKPSPLGPVAIIARASDDQQFGFAIRSP